MTELNMEELVSMVNYTVNNTSYDSGRGGGPPLYYINMARLATSIQRNSLRVICVLGLPGNLAAILTIATVRPLTTATLLVALLAASDSVALVTKLIINQLYFYLPRLNDHYCRSLALVNVCSSFANWVLVLIAFERLVAVMLPMLRHRFLSKRRIYCICVVVALAIFSVHAPLIAGRVVKRRRCGPIEELEFYEYNVWHWVNTLVYFLLPVVLLQIITTAVCVSLRRAHHRRLHLLGSVSTAGSSNSTHEFRRTERAMTCMMLAASFLFIVMVLPQCIYFILFHHIEAYAPMKHMPEDMVAQQVTSLLADSTHALNFYIYFVSVRRFRNSFLKLVRCQKTSRPSTSNSSSITRSSKRDTLNGMTLAEGLNSREWDGPGSITQPLPQKES